MAQFFSVWFVVIWPYSYACCYSSHI